MKITIWLIAGILFFPQYLFPQDDGYNSSDSDTITTKLRTLYRFPCAIEDIINFDKVKKPLNSNEGGFEDPYNTLRNCFVFTYYRDSVSADEDKPKLSVGIFKDGKIIARLDTSIFTFGSTGGRIKTTADLNKDGELEIITTRTLGASPPPWEEYWIFSWNGKRLRLISAIDNEMKQSALQSPWDYLKFIDIDGDGIFELVTNFEDEKGIEREHVYSWNGKLYGEWGKGSKALLQSSSKKKRK